MAVISCSIYISPGKKWFRWYPLHISILHLSLYFCIQYFRIPFTILCIQLYIVNVNRSVTRTSLARIFRDSFGQRDTTEKLGPRDFDGIRFFIVLRCEWNAWRNVAYLTMKQGLNDNRRRVTRSKCHRHARMTCIILLARIGKNAYDIRAASINSIRCCHTGFKPYDKKISWCRIRDLVLVTRFRQWMAFARCRSSSKSVVSFSVRLRAGHIPQYGNGTWCYMVV